MRTNCDRRYKKGVKLNLKGLKGKRAGEDGQRGGEGVRCGRERKA